MSTKLCHIRVKHNTVFASRGHTNAIVSVALSRMEVEDKHQTGPIEANYLVALVLCANVRWITCKPTMTLFCVVHGSIKLIKEAIFEQRIINQIPLSASIVIRLIIAFAREVQPLRMACIIFFFKENIRAHYSECRIQ